MKSIKKLKSAGKVVAGSALLVGATLTGAAGLAAAQDDSGSTDLGDYPAPFLSDDGEVQSTIVVGEDAATTDVVGAINVAGSLGNAAFETSEEVVEGASAGWSASNGVSLETANENLLFGDSISSVRETLVEGDIDALQSATFTDDAGEETRIDYYLNLPTGADTLTSEFGTTSEMDDDADPVLHVPLPTSVDNSNYVYNLQANFGDSINFTEEAVAGEEIELFGDTYTVSEQMSSDDNKLVLWGQSEEMNLQTGESGTFTVEGEEHTVEVRYVDSSGESVTLRVDGNPERVDNGESFTVDGQDVRVSGLFPEGDGEGIATFQIGSDEVVLQDGSAIKSDDETVEGTHVQFNGEPGSAPVDEISSIDVYVGPEDDSNDRIEAGGSFSHDFFSDVEVQFGGLNPDAADAEGVSEIEVSYAGEENAETTFTHRSGGSATVNFANYDSSLELADSNGDSIHTVEGANVTQGEYFTSDAGGFSHLWEVTTVSWEQEDSEVTFEDSHTGQEVQVTSWESSDSSSATTTKIIDGQRYEVSISDTGGVDVTWSGSDRVSAYTPVHTDAGASVALAEPTGSINMSERGASEIELPSTLSTDDAYVTVSSLFDASGSTNVAAGNNVNVDSSVGSGGDYQATVNGGQTYNVTANGDGTVSLTLAETSNPAVVAVQPEDEAENEHAYVVDTSYGDQVEVNSAEYSGTERDTESLGDDDSISVGYDGYGAYSEYDNNDEGVFTLNQPAAQATVGAAVTGADGEVSADGGAGSVETQSPTGWPDSAALDSDSNIDQTKTSEHTILVGGPAVNALTDELAQDDKTWTGDDYEEGDQLVQLVEDSFAEGVHSLVVSGYSGEDTRAAANYISNYGDHSEELSGQSQVNLQTMQTTE